MEDYATLTYNKLKKNVELHIIIQKFCIYYNINKYGFPYDTWTSFMSNPFETIIGYYLLFINSYQIYYNYDGITYSLLYNTKTIKKEKINNINEMYYKHIMYSFMLIKKINK